MGDGFRLSNEAITSTVTGGANANITGVTAHGVANDFALRQLFALRLANGTVITPANSTAGATTAVDIPAEPESIRLADRHAGKGVRTVYTYSEGSRSFEIIWTAILRDGGNHIQSTFEIGKVEGTFDVQSVDLFNAMLGGARIVGKDNGNPMAKRTVSGTNISFPIARSGDLKSGEVWNYSASITRWSSRPTKYWTWYSDSIWRDDHDAYRVGAGDQREQYINYRDSIVYTFNVAENPLFSITNLMNHGFIFSPRAPQFQADVDLSKLRYATAADMRGYFAMGFSLQELYVRNTIVDPARIGEDNATWFWDELAKNAKWSRENTALLTDAHWLGGNAALGEMYGTAAWSDVSGEEEGMVMLRNPSTRPQTYTLDIGETLELPYPHWIQLDMGEVQEINGFEYVPRTSGNNGSIDRYKLSVSEDGETWTTVSEGEFNGMLTYLEFDAVDARYIKLDALSEIESRTWATAAELRVFGPPAAPEVPRLVPVAKNTWVATCTSEELVAEAAGAQGPCRLAVDDNEDTYWHTKFGGGDDPMPHEIVVDMGGAFPVEQFEYIPRQGYDRANGFIADYELLLSLDNLAWTSVAEGTFEYETGNTAQRHLVYAATPKAEGGYTFSQRNQWVFNNIVMFGGPEKR